MTQAGGTDCELAMELAHWTVALRYDQIPAAISAAVKASMLDAVGCALGGAASEPAEIGRKVALDLSPTGSCTLIGSAQQTNVEHAAFVNSIAIRYLDYCDVFLGLEVTPPASCASVVWALCESMALPGQSCVLGLVVLYEAMLRLCSATSLHHRGWDTVTFQAIASAMAAARILALGVEQTYEAINIATTNAPALLQTRVGELSMWKGVASAYGARCGLQSTLLAARGMTGPREVFEGKHGLENQVCGPLDLPAGDEWRSTGVLIKKYPAQVYTQSAIEAALAVRAQLNGRPVTEIEQITIRTFRRAIDHTASSADRWQPWTRESADHSLPFLVAAALIDGEINQARFSPERIRAADISGLMAKIHVEEDPGMTARYPALMPARIQVGLAAGGTATGGALAAEVAAHEGHPARPMSGEALESKFSRLTAPVMPAGQAEELARRILAVDETDDIRSVTAMMAVAD